MTPLVCPTCHAPIPAHAPGGFCPACLLRSAEESGGFPKTSGPPLAEIQAALPELEIGFLIGQGGMGFVYKARQPSLDRTVALKILAPGLSHDPAFAERFAREARVLGKLNHPNIITVFEHGQSGGFYYLLMEYVEGVNLRQAMHAGRFTPEQALSVVPGICDALQAAHTQGIWHRDIKPENILLDGRGQVKIADFGIARIMGDPRRDFTLTMTGAALGSAAYMAPEQHEKPHEVDHRADIYSLGVVIYEMLTGELPLGRFPAPSQRAAVDTRMDEVVFRALEKERGRRQQSADEVKTDITAIPHGKPAVPKPKPSTNYGRWPLGFFLAGLLALPLLPVLLFGTLGRAESFFVTGVLLLMGLIFGLLSWKTRTDKLVVVAATSIFAMAGIHTYQEQLTEKNQTLGIPLQNTGEMEQPPATTARSATADAKPAPSPTPAPAPVPAPDVLTIFRTLNRLANERDIAAFQIHAPEIQVLFVGDRPVSEKMRNFAGEVLRLHLVSRTEPRPAPIGLGITLGSSAHVVAKIKAPDGITAWRQYRFKRKQEDWKYIGLDSLQWQSTAVVEFHPAGRDALTELRAHLDDSVTVESEEGKVDWFRLGTTATGDPPFGPDRAKFVLQTKLQSLEESLKKSGLEGSLKMRTPPAIPDEPVHLPDPPAKAASSPEKPRIVPVPAGETGQLQTSVSIVNGVRTEQTRFITDQGEVFPNVAAANAALRAQAPSAPGDQRPPQPAPAEELTGTPKLEKWHGSGRVAFTAHCGSSPMFTLLGKGSSNASQLHTSGSLIIQPSYLDFDGLRIHFSVRGPQTATIAGRQFDLSQGRVFTVSASGIRQFPLDCPLKLTDVTMRELLDKTGTGDQGAPEK